MNDTAVSVDISERVVRHPSQKQLRELLQMLMGTPAGVVQQVGYLFMLFVAVVKTGEPATDTGDGSGGSGTGGGNCGSQPQAARSAAGRLRGTTAEERKEAAALILTAHKELKTKKARGAGKAGKGGTCVVARSGPSDEAKAKGLQRWAAKGKRHVGQLHQLLLGSGAAVKGRQHHARLLNFHAKRISSEEAKKGSSAAAAAFEMMKTTIDGALDTCGEAKCVDMTAAVGTKPSLTATRRGQCSSDGSHDDDGGDLLLARKRSNCCSERGGGDAENAISAPSPPSTCAADVMDNDSEAGHEMLMTLERPSCDDAGSTQDTSAGNTVAGEKTTLDGHMPTVLVSGIGGATVTVSEAARAMTAQEAGITKEKQMARELESLRSLGSPHYTIELAGPHVGNEFLALGFANAGLDLHEVLADPHLHGGMSNLDMMRLFGGLVNGVLSILDQGFAHGNINPKSVRVVSGKKARWVIRDFDSAGAVLGQDHISGGLFFEYLAPEAMAYATGECNTPVLLRESIDAYALGQICYQILARDPMPPFSAETISAAMEVKTARPMKETILSPEVFRPPSPLVHMEHAVNIIASLLDDDPSQRLSVRALHDFASCEPLWESQSSPGQEPSGTLEAILGKLEKVRVSVDTKRTH
ncbi:unnamed protein product, partial [Ectocarpus fasciculatus]